LIKHCLIKKISGEGLSETDSTNYINKASLCPRNTDPDHIIEDVFNNLNGEVKPYRL